MILGFSFIFFALGATTFDASMSPSIRYVGQTGTVTYTISYTNPSANVNSVQIILPTGFSGATSVSGTCNSKSWTLDSSNPIKLSNHNSGNSGVFQSGRILAVTLTATPPTSSGSYVFTTMVYSDIGYGTNTGSANQPTLTVSYVPITITSSPNSGSGFITVDGSAQSTPYSPNNWVVGNTHTIAALTTVGTLGTRYIYSSWSDSGAQSHSITIPSSLTTYTANFNTENQLTVAISGISSLYPTHVYVAGISKGTAYDVSSYTQWFASTASSGTIGVDSTINGATGVRYLFTKWDADSSTANPRSSVTMSSAVTYTADFKTQYQVNFGVSESGSITSPSTGNGFYDSGSLTISALANAGYGFSQWSSNTGSITFASSTSSSTTATISGPGTISATFTANPVTLTLTPAAGGSIDANPSSGWHYDDVVTLTAKPATGYNFDSWGGALTGATNPTTIIMSGDQIVTASFTPIQYSITITPTGSGTVDLSPNKATYHYNDLVQLTANPSSGWSFGHWTGALSGSINPQSIIITGNTAVGIDFTQDQYTLTMNTVGDGCSVTKNPDQATYTYGTLVTLTPHAADGWTFYGFSGDITTGSISMTSSKTVTATFIINTYSITPSVVGGANGHGTISPSSIQTANYGSTPTFNFQSDKGYHVAEVIVDNVLTATTTSTSYTFSSIDASHSISVSFAPDAIITKLTVFISPAIYDTNNPHTLNIHGTLADESSTPLAGQTITLWYNVGQNWIQIDQTTPITTTATGDYSHNWQDYPASLPNGYYVIEARFEQNAPYQSAQADTNTTGNGVNLNVLPEYVFGSLAALGACFVGFAVFKKRKQSPTL